MQSNKIKKQNKSLEERGIPFNSLFIIKFQDGSMITEHECNWSELSETKVVNYFGGKKTIAVCIHPVKTLRIEHGEMTHTIEIPENCEVYQAIRAETNFMSNGIKKDKINGRVVGLVKDNEVIEEYFLNGLEGRIMGMKK